MKGLISELKDLAWNHHAGFEDRLNKAANDIRSKRRWIRLFLRV